jgi:hypothetical protein
MGILKKYLPSPAEFPAMVKIKLSLVGKLGGESQSRMAQTVRLFFCLHKRCLGLPSMNHLEPPG